MFSSARFQLHTTLYWVLNEIWVHFLRLWNLLKSLYYVIRTHTLIIDVIFIKIPITQVDCSKKGNISWYFPQRPTLCKQYLLCIAFTMVDSSLTKTIALIILFANIKEVHYRRPQLDTFYIVIWQQKSIIQLYKAVIRHYRIFQSLHNFPPRTFPPKNLATRVNTMENINLIVYYKQSSKNKPFEVSNQFLKTTSISNYESSQSSHHTARRTRQTQVVSCHITPPGGPGRPNSYSQNRYITYFI